MDIKALVAKARRDMDAVEHADQEVLIGDEKVTIRLWPMAGIAWRDLCSMHPNRSVSEFDQALGYNLSAVTQNYPRVFAVDGDEVTDLTEDWADICAVLSGPDLKALEYVVWGLNEYEPTLKLAAVGKASAGSRKKKRS